MITLTSLEEKIANDSFDNTEYIGDLSYPKIDFRSNVWMISFEDIVIVDYIEIDAGSEMRIDKLAKYLYGDEDFMDIILKFNKMGNSFEMKQGDIIKIPELNSFMRNIRKVTYKSKYIEDSMPDTSRTADNKGKTHTVKSNDKRNRNYKKGSNGVLVFKK